MERITNLFVLFVLLTITISACGEDESPGESEVTADTHVSTDMGADVPEGEHLITVEISLNG